MPLTILRREQAFVVGVDKADGTEIRGVEAELADETLAREVQNYIRMEEYGEEETETGE
jgi:hypothetical protein